MKYMEKILVANEESMREMALKTLPTQAMARHPKCSQRTVDRGPMTKRNPYPSEPTHAGGKRRIDNHIQDAVYPYLSCYINFGLQIQLLQLKSNTLGVTSKNILFKITLVQTFDRKTAKTLRS